MGVYLPQSPGPTSSSALLATGGKGASLMCADTRPDAVLVACAQAGDDEAFTHLFLRYDVEIYRCSMKLVGNDEIAKDIRQDAFLKAWINIRKIQDPMRFKSWLLTIVRNLAFDTLRRNFREQTDPLLEQRVASNPIEGETRLEKRELVLHILAEMEPKFRDILLWTEEGYSQVEIAHLLGYSDLTVSNYLSKARQQFRRIYYCLTDMADGLERGNEFDGR